MANVPVHGYSPSSKTHKETKVGVGAHADEAMHASRANLPAGASPAKVAGEKDFILNKQEQINKYALAKARAKSGRLRKAK